MVQWTSKKDQIILRGVFKFYDIKNSATLLDFLAKEIGEDCTRKAVSHRLNKIRGGKVDGARSNGSNENTPKHPTTPRSRPKATLPRKTTGDYNSGPEDPTDDEEDMQSPSAARGKRAANQSKVSYTDYESTEDEHYMKKRIKTKKDQTTAEIIGLPVTYMSDDEI